MKPPKKSVSETRREVLLLLQTEGIVAAAKAAIAVCNDPNAPPNARATASGLILRTTALGGFGKSNEIEDDGAKAEHEMTVAEIDRRLAQLDRGRSAHDPDDDAIGEGSDDGTASAFD